MIKINHLRRQFSSIRLLAILSPNSYLRKMIIVSTLINTDKRVGQTAIKQVDAFNNLHIKDFNYGFKIIKQHTSIKDAINYHTEIINTKRFTDCEEVNL